MVEEAISGGTPPLGCPCDEQGGQQPARVTGGPVGPDGTLNKVLEPLEHSVLDHADRHVFSQEVLEPLEHSVLDAAGRPVTVGPLGTLSPSDCHPAGPAGPYVAGGPVGPDGTFWNR